MENNKFEKSPNEKIGIIVIISLIIIFVIMIGIKSFSQPADANAKNPNGKAPSQKEKMKGNPNEKSEEENAITVSALKMEKSYFQKTVKLNGDVSSNVKISMYPDISGKITSIRKKVGDKVYKGEVICYVDQSKAGFAYVASPLKSTISGTILELNYSLGDTVSSNSCIATIGDLSDLAVTVYVPEKYSDYLKKGLKAKVSLQSTPDDFFNAKITSINPVVNKNNRTIEIKLNFDEPDIRIKPGMFASVDLVIIEHEDTFYVPKGAIKIYNDRSSVYIIENNRAKRVFVETGISNDSHVEIISGLEEGMNVIIAGTATEDSLVKIAGGK